MQEELKKSAGFVRAAPKRDGTQRSSLIRKMAPLDPPNPPAGALEVTDEDAK